MAIFWAPQNGPGQSLSSWPVFNWSLLLIWLKTVVVAYSRPVGLTVPINKPDQMLSLGSPSIPQAPTCYWVLLAGRLQSSTLNFSSPRSRLGCPSSSCFPIQHSHFGYVPILASWPFGHSAWSSCSPSPHTVQLSCLVMFSPWEQPCPPFLSFFI